MQPKLHFMNAPSSDLPLHIPGEWLIRALVLGSMLIQVFLVGGGHYRYRSSSRVLSSAVWLAYMSADVVAISALGIMAHSLQTQLIYGVWAPLLLLHLGGPDTITAYSTADNELWIRHGFIMIYQVSVAGYVVYLSSLQGYVLASSILLFIAGATKYAERTLALRYASFAQIVNSTEPVYKFMQHEDEIDMENNRVDYNYLVMGEEQFHRKLKAKQRGETDSWNDLLQEREIVTIKNVWHQEGLQITNNYILCVSHALFKMYKRRFVSLYFHEGVRAKTRKFFINDSVPSKKLFRIVEMELKFMYDVLFSKSSGTAFSKTGTLIRLINTCLLGLAVILLYVGANFKPALKIVTYILISVALAVEVIQLYRIAVSDWTMVRLICAYIQHFRRPISCSWFMFKLIQLAISLLDRFRNAGGCKCWKESVTQYSVIDACSSKRSSLWYWPQHCSSKWSSRWYWPQCVGKFGYLIVPPSLRLLHMEETPVEDDFKDFVLAKLKATCSPNQEFATCRARVYDYDDYLVRMGCGDLQWASDLEMEDLILTWHIATTICKKKDASSAGAPPVATSGAAAGPNPNIRFSSLLSGYCAYLFVSHPNLLPLHPEIAKTTYIELHYDLVPHLKEGIQKLIDHNSNTTLGLGTKLAQQLLEKPQRWEILSGYWAGLLIYMAVYNKAPLHAERLACGGEFLSQVWALLGHVGCGEQSDTAVRRKKEEKSKTEKEEEKRKRRQEESEKNRRNQKRSASEWQKLMLQNVYHGSSSV